MNKKSLTNEVNSYKIMCEKALTRLKLMTFQCREARLKNSEGDRDG